MDEQTRKLLEECTSGCKMAVSSIQQILEFTQDSALQKILNKYIEQHTHLQQTAESQLSADGFEPKDPGMLASAFSWFTTEIKLGMNSDNSEIAKVLIDGCSMGIKTLGERANTLCQADKSADSIARRIIKLEEEIIRELEPFLYLVQSSPFRYNIIWRILYYDMQMTNRFLLYLTKEREEKV